jgi:hypothetical protein
MNDLDFVKIIEGLSLETIKKDFGFLYSASKVIASKESKQE